MPLFSNPSKTGACGCAIFTCWKGAISSKPPGNSSPKRKRSDSLEDGGLGVEAWLRQDGSGVEVGSGSPRSRVAERFKGLDLRVPSGVARKRVRVG